VLGYLALFFLPLVNNSNPGKTMLSTKRFDGSLTITTSGNTSTLTLHSPVVVIEGDLDVRGTAITGSVVNLETTNTIIQDNIITLNGGATGVPLNSLTSGIEINRGSRTTVGIRWSESLARWEFTDDGSNWYAMLKGPALSRVVDDLSPQLGGHLDTNGHGIQFTKLTNAQIPLGLTTANAVYGAEPGSGGSGLRFTTYSTKLSAYTQDELVSRKKSIVHSLIFG
jgi:hypothetical protein